VTANNLATTTSFTLGTTADLSGTTVSVAGPGVSGTAATAVEATVANLSPATTYYWRLSATNAAGAVSGAIASFRTLGSAPAVTTGPSDTVASTTARVSGEVHPQQIATEAFVQWATVPDFVTLAGTVVIGQVGGGAPVPVTATLPDLVPGTTYYWRVAATNSAGTTAGTTGSFVTPTFGKGRALARDRLATQLAIDPLTTTVTAIEPLARSRRVCSLAGGAAAPRLRLTGLGACDLRVRLLRAGVESVEVLRLAVR
jgi:phosphodiesterase/alkaline phosphatase D-like protein